MTTVREDGHHCHAPGCSLPVPPKMLACSKHWFMLPKNLRDKVWAAYEPGQEIRKNPTIEYMDVFNECQAYWKSKETIAQQKKA